jgi:hypothetical protein
VGNKTISLDASIRKKDGKERENKRKGKKTNRGRKQLVCIHISYAFPLPEQSK